MPRIDPTVQLRWARFAAAAFCAFAAVNHVRLGLDGAPSVARHFVFVGVNVLLGTLVVVAPRAALVFAVPLAVQQFWSHGNALAQSMREPPFDWSSVGVLFFFPALLVVLVLTAVRERPRADGRE